jgi:vacuolar-type H+-ATPase subunit H
MNHPDKTRIILAQALEPFRKASIDEASERARRVVEHVREEMAKHGGKLDESAPNRADTGSQLKRQLFLRLATRIGPRQSLPSRTSTYEVTPEAERSFIDQAEHQAEANYQAYVDKMRRKIAKYETTSGPITSVTAHSIVGRGDLWGGSTINIRFGDGTLQRWNTKRIVNISVYGMLFNQWPTRQIM